MIIVDLVAATICFGSPTVECYPILYGDKTPTGDYETKLRLTEQKGYGGSVIQFTTLPNNTVLAIHTLWTLNPEQRREERIQNADVSQRIITNGCINVQPEVYNKLLDCCTNTKLTIKR